MQNNLKRVRHQGSRARDLKLSSEEFRSRYACYCRNRPLLQRLIDQSLPPLVDYAVRVHVWNCYRCRQVYAELEELSGVKREAEDATEFLRKLTPLRVAKKESPGSNLVDNQKTLIKEAHEVLERLKRK